MKWFWTIIAVLSVATAGWFIWSAMKHAPANAPGPISTFDAPVKEIAPPTRGAGEPARAEPGGMVDPPTVEEAKSAAKELPASPSGEPKSELTPAQVAAEQWLKDIDALIASSSSPSGARPGHEGHAPPGAGDFKSAPDAAASNAPAASDPKDRKARWGEVVPARKSEQPDGSTLFDERFSLTGKGTPEDPIVVTWDYLVSASETYQPRLGKNRLPERITYLDDKWVRVVGYVAFPILSTSPNEMLSMRNMWDGCCIGVPPTPYDAIEVRLKDGASPQQRLMRFGSVEGKLTVDPYVKGNWLLGLYVMDDAKVSEAKNAGL